MPVSIENTVIRFNDGTTQSTAAGAGGVTSLNGQTGAITNTSLDAIGSYVAAIVGSSFSGSYNPYKSNQTVGNTIAGSSLRYNYSTINMDPGQWYAASGTIGGVGANYVNSAAPNQAVSYGGGGSSLSGTWRCMGTDYRYYINDVDNSARGYWAAGLFVRVS